MSPSYSARPALITLRYIEFFARFQKNLHVLETDGPGLPQEFGRRDLGPVRCRGGNQNGEGGRETATSTIRISDFQIVDVRFCFVGKCFQKHMLVRYRGINTKGVQERPGTKWKMLMIITRTLRFQYCRKVKLLMPCPGNPPWSVRSHWIPPDLLNSIENMKKQVFLKK